MNPRKSTALFVLVIAAAMTLAAQEDLPSELKELALRDSACAQPIAGSDPPVLSALPIRAGMRDLGTIVKVQGACHCESANCDVLVYLRADHGYRLALREKYASLHPMKIVKRGMPSLTGQFEIGPARMETTVYDWDGQQYRPSLCATVVKGGRVPSIAQHPCKSSAP